MIKKWFDENLFLSSNLSQYQEKFKDYFSLFSIFVLPKTE